MNWLDDLTRKARFRFARFLFNFFGTVRMDFYVDFADALRDGAGESSRLRKLEERALARHSLMAPLYSHWRRKMKRMPFSLALQHTVPEHEAMILSVAEDDNRLPEGLEILSRAIGISREIKTAELMQTYSSWIGLMVLLVFMVMYDLLIAPANKEALPMKFWPASTMFLYTVAHSITAGWFVYLSGLVVTVAAINWSKANWKGRLRVFFDGIPLLPWRNHRDVQATTFLMTLAILLDGKRFGPGEAFRKMRDFSTPWLAWHLSRMNKRLELAPSKPALAVNTGIFSRSLLDRIEDYADRSDFNVALKKIAFDHSERHRQRALSMAMIKGTIAMLALAAVMLFIVFSNYELNQAIDNATRSMV